MLRLLLHYSRRASAALARGASLKAVLATGLDERLLRLSELRPPEIDAEGGALLAQIDQTLQALEEAA